MDYEASKRLARDPDPAVRRDLAVREEMKPEILYYLASDPAVEVRRAVAANRSTPVQASEVLVGDGDESVRRLLAQKLARLLPDLDPEGQGKLFSLAVQTLETLALDQALGVRQALATALADIACAPPPLCLRLAHDIAREVAEPILHYCATLSDRDLLGLIAEQPESWVLAAIARRREVSEPVSAALYAAGDEDATGTLIGNAGARIPEGTLSGMVEDSRIRRAWQEPLARRPSLPARLAVRLAEFVDQQVLEILSHRPDLDAETSAEVVAAARRRMDFVEGGEPGESPEQRAARLFGEGRLDEPTIGDALACGDMGFVKAALALRAGLKRPVVETILNMQSPKGVTALAWKAGLSMRGAMLLQSRGAHIPPRQLLNARDGTDYPLSEGEMEWQLELYADA